MKNSWNSIVFVKAHKGMPAAMSKMMGVEKMWSTSGEWDWCIKLDQSHSSPEQTEMFVNQLRMADWVSHTQTSWWKEVNM